MNSKNVSGSINPPAKKLASYHGLTVQIISSMKNYSLIRWRDQESIAVDTQDLQLVAELAA